MRERLIRVVIDDMSSLQIGEDSNMDARSSLPWTLPVVVSMSSIGESRIVFLTILQIFARTLEGVAYSLRRSTG